MLHSNRDAPRFIGMFAFSSYFRYILGMPKWIQHSILVVGLLVWGVGFEFLAQPANPLDHRTLVFIVPHNITAGRIVKSLHRRGVIRNPLAVKYAIKCMGMDRHIHAGTYHLSPRMSTWRIIRTLGTPPPSIQIRVVIPEGYTLKEISKVLEKKGVISAEDFVDIAESRFPRHLRNKYEFLKNLPTTSIEGYLFPDTYLMASGSDPALILDMMLARFQEVAVPLLSRKTIKSRYGVHELMTLASIIEKEASDYGEKTLVSSVFHNRLRAGMMLASCPTVKYALGNPRKPQLYFRDLEVESPYNTYKHTGLPPGPICNPGLESMLAAMHPAPSHYYYFAARGNGRNIFTTSAQGHINALYEMGYLKKEATQNEETGKAP